jgi:glycosyltransferase involved in cell wall biosynthesis
MTQAPQHKTINIVFRSTGVGLDQDAQLIKETLEAAGHVCTLSRYKDVTWLQAWWRRQPLYDANIFLERVHPRWFSYARNHYLIPNQERFPKRHLRLLKKINTVLCKTQHAQDVFAHCGVRTHLTHFTSTDCSQAQTSMDYGKFFHLAGKSTLKGTQDLLALWSVHPHWPQLTVVQHAANAPKQVPKNVRLLSHFLSQAELRHLQNSHGVHLCPSQSEGWGHYINEAMSCKALVVTTDAPPMNELVTADRGMVVAYERSEPRHLGSNFYFSADALTHGIERLQAMSHSEKQVLGVRAREWYLFNHSRFVHALQTFFA